MKRKLGMALLYLLFGLASYFVFLYLTFPSDVARERLIYEADKAGIRLQLADLKPYPPLGVYLKDVDIYGSTNHHKMHSVSGSRLKPHAPGTGLDLAGGMPDKEGDRDEATVGTDSMESPDTPPVPVKRPLVTFDSLKVSSLLPLLVPGDGTFGTVNVDAELYGGQAEASYSESEHITHLVMNVEELDLSRYPIVADDFQILLSGKLGFAADVSINKEKIRESSGEFEFDLDNLVIQKGSKIKGFDIPMVLAFHSPEGKAVIKGGRAELSDMTFESGPLTVTLSGSIMLNKTLSRCRLNLKVGLKFGDDLQFVAAFLPSSAKSDDGFYHYVLSGPIDRLRTRPDRLAARNRKSKSVGSRARLDRSDRALPGRGHLRGTDLSNIPEPRGAPGVLGGPGGRLGRLPALDDDERKQLREERRRRAEERRKRRQALREQRMKELDKHRKVPSVPEKFHGLLYPDEVEPADDVDVQYREPPLDDNLDEPVNPGPDLNAPDGGDIIEPNQWDEEP